MTTAIHIYLVLDFCCITSSDCDKNYMQKFRENKMIKIGASMPKLYMN